MKKVLFFLLMILFSIVSINAQTFKWNSFISGIYKDIVSDVAVDGSGNVYAVGTFKNSVDFDPGSGYYYMNEANIDDKGDVFCFKLNSEGKFIWAKQVGGYTGSVSVTDPDVLLPKLSLDSSGNVYITGKYDYKVNFETKTGSSYYIPNPELSDQFLAKLDTNGNFQWAKAIGQATSTPRISINPTVKNISIDNVGNIYLSGYFEGNLDFDSSINSYFLTADNNYNDAFLLKLNNSGDFVWAGKIGNNGNDDFAYDMDVNNGYLYLTGLYKGSVDFDITNSTNILVSNANTQDIFIAKYDLDGKIQWARTFGNDKGWDEGLGIKSDKNGNVYCTGKFRNFVDFDPDPINNFTLYTFGSIGNYLLKLNTSGNFIWAKNFEATDIGGMSSRTANIFDVGVNDYGVYITGNYVEKIDCDPSANKYELIGKDGNFEIFVISLSTDGLFNRAKSFPSTKSDYPYALWVNNNYLFVAGYFTGTIMLDNINVNGDDTYPSYNGFLAKFSDIANLNTKDFNLYSDNIVLYPNPTNGNISLNSKTIVKTVSILDQSGKLLKDIEINNNVATLNLQNYPNGIYYLRLNSFTQSTLKKIIIKK